MWVNAWYESSLFEIDIGLHLIWVFASYQLLLYASSGFQIMVLISSTHQAPVAYQNLELNLFCDSSFLSWLHILYVKIRLDFLYLNCSLI